MFSYGFPMLSYGLPVVFLRIAPVFLCMAMDSHGFPIIFLWLPIDFLLFPYIASYNFYNVFLLFSYGFPLVFYVIVWIYSLPNGSYDFPPGPDPRCRPVEAWAGFLQFCVCARMRAPYICDGGWNLKNKISQELVFLWLPPVSNQFLSLSHGFPMISDSSP